MALSANTTWEVRGGAGSDNNGGGFVTGASGVDYSQQDSAQASGTNLTVDGTTNTDVTPDGHTVSADDVGNLIQITAGAGWTQGFYQIVSIQGGTKWRLDRSPAATSTSGGTWALGGALATLAKPLGAVVSGNTIYVKATATYTLTSSLVPGVNHIRWIGYDSSRTDYLASSITGRPLVTTATNSTALWFNSSTDRFGQVFFNFRFSNTAASRWSWLSLGSASWIGATFVRCQWDGFTNVVSGSPYAVRGFTFTQCEIKNGSNGGITFPNNGGEASYFFACWIHDNTGDGVNTNDAIPITLNNCIITNNSQDGVAVGANNKAHNISRCVVFGNGRDGIRMGGGDAGRQTHVNNCIIYGNGAWGINRVSAPSGFGSDAGGWNAFGANTSGARNNFSALPGDVALSGDPFTDSGADDFTLNNTAGAGAACRGVGAPAAIP